KPSVAQALRKPRTQSSTIGRSGAPDSPPPPYLARGDVSLPKIFFQPILLGMVPHGMVLLHTMASHKGCEAIRAAVSGGTSALSLSISGRSYTSAAAARLRMEVASSKRCVGSRPTFGQERLICRARLGRLAARGCRRRHISSISATLASALSAALIRETTSGWRLRQAHPARQERIDSWSREADGVERDAGHRPDDDAVREGVRGAVLVREAHVSLARMQGGRLRHEGCAVVADAGDAVKPVPFAGEPPRAGRAEDVAEI